MWHFYKLSMRAGCGCYRCAGECSALVAIMRMWTERQIEFGGVFEIKLSTTALALLLNSRQAELFGIQVCSAACQLRRSLHGLPL